MALDKEYRQLAGGTVIAAVLWTIMFSPWTSPHVNFWLMMSCSGIILSLYAFWAGKDWKGLVKFDLRNIGIGIVIAAALWGVFWIGDKLSSLMFDFARPQVDMIYGMKEGENPVIITLLLLFVIGPAEELFWRGYLQRTLSAKLNPDTGFAITLFLYSMVHISKMNFMLIMAAMVAGGIWGLLYRFFPKKLGALVISHALWDCAVFIWFPIM